MNLAGFWFSGLRPNKSYLNLAYEYLSNLHRMPFRLSSKAFTLSAKIRFSNEFSWYKLQPTQRNFKSQILLEPVPFRPPIFQSVMWFFKTLRYEK